MYTTSTEWLSASHNVHCQHRVVTSTLLCTPSATNGYQQATICTPPAQNGLSASHNVHRQHGVVTSTLLCTPSGRNGYQQATICTPLPTNGYQVVAHGRVVTSSGQITEVKQRRARLVLGWVTDAQVTLPAMCRGVGQAFHIMPPLSTQQWWVPGGMNNGELWMAIAAENALNSPQRRWDHTRESSNTRGVNCEVCWTRCDIRL